MIATRKLIDQAKLYTAKIILWLIQPRKYTCMVISVAHLCMLFHTVLHICTTLSKAWFQHIMAILIYVADLKNHALCLANTGT